MTLSVGTEFCDCVVETHRLDVFEEEFVCFIVVGEFSTEDHALCVVGVEFRGESYSFFGADLVEYVGGLDDRETRGEEGLAT
jgi:hypothetical protein